MYNHDGGLIWAKNVYSTIKAAATVADIDPGTPGLEILVGSGNGKLNAFHADGTAVSGFPVTLGTGFYRILAAPAVADLDGDSSLDIVVPVANGRLYALNADGTAKWDASIGDIRDTYNMQTANSSPTIADLDNDGSKEIIVGSYDENVYAFRANGNLLWQFATDDVIMGKVAVANVRTDIDGKEVVVASGDGYVYLLDEAGEQIWRQATGWSIRSAPLVVDMDGNGDLEILVGSDDHKVWAWHHTGAVVAGWPQSTSAPVFAAPTFGDVDGDGDGEIVAGSDDGFVYAWEADGTAVPDWPVQMDGAIKGTPALANLDMDAALETIATDFAGRLQIVGEPYRVYLPMATNGN